MSKRLLGVFAVGMVLAATIASPAFAVEEGAAEGATEHTTPDLEEIRASQVDNPVADDVLPPEQVEPPGWTQWLYIPLTVVGILMVVFLGFRYLQWQPRFAEERRRKSRR